VTNSPAELPDTNCLEPWYFYQETCWPNQVLVLADVLVLPLPLCSVQALTWHCRNPSRWCDREYVAQTLDFLCPACCVQLSILWLCLHSYGVYEILQACTSSRNKNSKFMEYSYGVKTSLGGAVLQARFVLHNALNPLRKTSKSSPEIYSSKPPPFSSTPLSQHHVIPGAPRFASLHMYHDPVKVTTRNVLKQAGTQRMNLPCYTVSKSFLSFAPHA
jgi:hypothetical protein